MRTTTKIRLAATLSQFVRSGRRVLGRTDVVTCRRSGIQWELDLKDGIEFALYLGIYERSTQQYLRESVSAGDIVVDIGANIGAVTLPLAKRVGPSGHVYAFEPTEHAFGRLTRNLQRNPSVANRVTATQAMVVNDEASGMVESIPSSWPLHPGDEAELHGVHGGQMNSTAGASAVMLDRWAVDNDLTRLDLVKLDVDGFECGVLAGAQKTLKRFQPTIVMELAPYCLEEKGADLSELLGLLYSANYVLHHLPNTHIRGQKLRRLEGTAEELRQKLPDGTSMNVVALPAR